MANSTGPAGKWKSGTTHDSPKFARTDKGHTVTAVGASREHTIKYRPDGGRLKNGSRYSAGGGPAKVKKSDPIAKFMGKMQKKSRKDYWGPGGPPKGKDADLAKRFAVWKRET